MSSGPLLFLCLLLGGLVALVGLFRPFLGFLVFLVIHFVQPGELVPALAPLRIELVYGVLLLVAMVREKKGGIVPIFKDRIVFAGILLLAAGVLSVPFAIWVGGAATTAMEMFKLLVVLMMIKLMVDTPDRLRKFLWCLVAIGTWVAASSLIAFSAGQFYELSYNEGNISRAEGLNSLVGGPNELAGLLLGLLPLGIALFRAKSSFWSRLFLIVAGGLSVWVMVLAGSRTAFLGLLVMALIFVFRAKHKLVSAVLCAALLLALWAGMPQEYKKRYLTVEAYAAGGQLDDSNELRLYIWKSGWRIFLHDPLFGVGAGQFATGYGLLILKGRHEVWMQPHNLVVQTACELGIVGLLALGNFLLQITRGIGATLRRSKNQADPLLYQVGVACSVMFVGVVLISALGHTLFRPYWYLLGGLVAAAQSLPAVEKKEEGLSGVVAAPRVTRRFRQHSLAGHLNR